MGEIIDRTKTNYKPKSLYMHLTVTTVPFHNTVPEHNGTMRFFKKKVKALSVLSVLALLAKGKISLCDGLSSVTCPSSVFYQFTKSSSSKKTIVGF